MKRYLFIIFVFVLSGTNLLQAQKKPVISVGGFESKTSYVSPSQITDGLNSELQKYEAIEYRPELTQALKNLNEFKNRSEIGVLDQLNVSEGALKEIRAKGADYLIFGAAHRSPVFPRGEVVNVSAFILDVETREVGVIGVADTPKNLLKAFDSGNFDSISKPLAYQISKYIFENNAQRRIRFRIQQLESEKKGRGGTMLFLTVGTIYTTGLTALGFMAENSLLKFAGPVSGSALIYFGLRNVIANRTFNKEQNRLKKEYKQRFAKDFE